MIDFDVPYNICFRGIFLDDQGNNSWPALSYSFIVPLILLFYLLTLDLESVRFFKFPIALGLILSHIISIRGLLLVSSNPRLLFPKSNNKQGYKWYAKYIGMLVWFITIVQILYTEVLLVWKIDFNFFGSEGAINVQRLVYFVIATFSTVGSDIVPTDKFGRIVTMGIIIASIIYLVVFIGTILPIQSQTIDKKVFNRPKSI
ncbi:ion channel [Desulfitobacterium sp.]|uniref:ion channel n=1 Tax=Desulfitobacterium sp. TaxID=49981 RepID=UPI002C3F86D6|nr:ion channel [Desulfitobacterium sp.]HVJ48100.1 ion channel [Desulfitobacterium sp.]